LFAEPDRAFHAAEIIRRVQSGSGAVQRELAKLAKAGLITVTVSGNRKLYQANRASPIFPELYGLLAKTTGLVEPLRQTLAPLRPRIAFAFVYGSVAKGTDTAKSDIDLMIVGDRLAYEKVYRALAQVEADLHRTVNPNIMTKAAWQQAVAAKNPFVARVLAQPKLFVLGGERDAPGAR
jgi:predicted nucleotidyltransferase